MQSQISLSLDLKFGPDILVNSKQTSIYTCQICKFLVSYEAVRCRKCPNNYLYCINCLESYIKDNEQKCPQNHEINKIQGDCFVQSTISGLEVKCPNQSCQYHCSYQDLIIHINICPFQQIKCEFCQFNFKRENLKNHQCQNQQKIENVDQLGKVQSDISEINLSLGRITDKIEKNLNMKQIIDELQLIREKQNEIVVNQQDLVWCIKSIKQQQIEQKEQFQPILEMIGKLNEQNQNNQEQSQQINSQLINNNSLMSNIDIQQQSQCKHEFKEWCLSHEAWVTQIGMKMLGNVKCLSNNNWHYPDKFRCRKCLKFKD